MRCLYCGNELALLKKLTGYGEFCSEAHRQKYQEQYNRLALTRLLQAQDAEPERRLALSRTPVRPAGGPCQPRREVDGAHAEVGTLPPAAPSVGRSPLARGAEPPELRGFLPHAFEPALSPVELFSAGPFLAPVTASLPGPPAEDGSGAFKMENRLASLTGLEDPAEALLDVSHGDSDASLDAGQWTLLSMPFDLTLARVTSAPIRGEAAPPSDFSVEYEHTLGDLPCLASAIGSSETNPADLEPTAPATSVVSPRGVAAAAGRNGSSNVTRPTSPLPEPDSSLFETVEQVKAAPTRPPVVINFAALGMLDPEFAAEQKLLEQTLNIAPVSEPQAELLTGPVKVPILPSAVEEIHSQPEKVPLLCSQAVFVDLRLVNDAFTPIDDAKFEIPVFEVQTPNVATCPLRPKVVFGPSPIWSEPIEAAPEAVRQTSVDQESTSALLGEQLTDGPPAREELAQSLLLVQDATPAGPLVTEERLETELPVASESDADTDRAENPLIASRRRIDEVTRRLREQSVSGPPPVSQSSAPVVTQPSASQQQPASMAQPVESPPPAAEEPRSGADVKPAARSRASLSDLEAIRKDMERQPAPSYGVPGKSRRIAVLVALIVAILLLGYLLREAFAAKMDPDASSIRVESYGPALITGEGGWPADWTGPDTGAIAGRQFEVFRPSLTMSDYRFEFRGQIQTKALGWIFRAANPRNYYAMKLEIIDAGNLPKAFLTRMATVDGQETQKAQTALSMQIRPDTVFTVRTDVLGSTFRTYIQDQLADTWIDDRLKIGGIGLLKDRDELADVRLIQLHALKVAN